VVNQSGKVTVTRVAHRALGLANPRLPDALLNLPRERHFRPLTAT
jgi:hypothetical protein